MTGATIDFIKNNTGDQPFLAVLSFYAVHTPLEAKKEDKKRNKKQLESMTFEGPGYLPQGEGRNKQHQDDADYAGMVENVDENVGKLLQTLKEKMAGRVCFQWRVIARFLTSYAVNNVVS